MTLLVYIWPGIREEYLKEAHVPQWHNGHSEPDVDWTISINKSIFLARIDDVLYNATRDAK